MSLKSAGTGLLGFLVVSLSVASIWIVPVLNVAGFRRPLEDIGTHACQVEQSLPACEKLVLHKPSGLLYASCSTPLARSLWTPALDRFVKPQSLPESDSFAIIDTSLPLSSTSIKRVTLTELPVNDPHWRGLNLVGLDVVESDSEPGALWVYVINHRSPLAPLDFKMYGADSSVEIFHTKIGSDTFQYVRTVEDSEYIITPNDVIGMPDGSGFWVSNDHTHRTGIRRYLENAFGIEGPGITFCNIKKGCGFAITGLPGINGITRSPKEMQTRGKDSIYAAENGGKGRLFILERQSDNSLVLTDTVNVGYVMDNIHVNPDGSIHVATFPRPLTIAIGGYIENPFEVLCPSSVHRISVNPKAFYGDKYVVDKVFETNGTLISGATSAVWDESHGILWMNGVASLGLVACKL